MWRRQSLKTRSKRYQAGKLTTAMPFTVQVVMQCFFLRHGVPRRVEHRLVVGEPVAPDRGARDFSEEARVLVPSEDDPTQIN